MSRKDKKMGKNYIFPEWLAAPMRKMDMRLQYESSMMSMTLILVGLLLTGIYMTFFVKSFPIWYKITLVVNVFAGVGFLGSMLVTTFQQYQSYISALDFQKELKGGNLNNGEE